MIGEPVTRAHRPVLARRDALRAADRAAPVRGHRPVPDAAAGAALEPRARHPRAARRARALAARATIPTTGPPTRTPSPPRSAELLGSRAPGRAWSGRAAELDAPARARSRRPGTARRARSWWPASPGSARRRCSTRWPPRRCAAAASALWGRAEPEDRAYGVWRPVLRALPGEPDAALAPLLGGGGEPGGEEDRLGLFDAVAAALAPRGRRPAAARDPRRPALGRRVVAAPARARRRRRAGRAAADRAARRGRRWSCAPRRSSSPGSTRRRRARAAAGRAAGRRRGDRPRPHGRQPVLRRRAGPAAGRRRAGASPRACARSFARAWSSWAPRSAEVLEAGAVAGRFTIADLVRAAGVPPRGGGGGGRARRVGGRGRRGPSTRPGTSCSPTRSCARPSATGLSGPRRGALHEAVADALRVRRDAGADVSAARIAHHALAAARERRRPAAGLGRGAGGGARGGGGARPRRGRAPLRAMRSKRSRSAPRRRPPSAARRCWRSPTRRSRPATSRPHAAATRRRRPRRRARGRRGGAGAGRARLLAGLSVRRRRHRGDRRC